MVITKELFIETIGTLQQQTAHDIKCSNAFEVILPDAVLAIYDNQLIINQLVKILKIATDDNSDWIEYFIYDLDFGVNWKEGMVTFEDKDIKLQTPIDLWNLLMDNQR
jgi:hypothetical protein